MVDGKFPKINLTNGDYVLSIAVNNTENLTRTDTYLFTINVIPPTPEEETEKAELGILPWIIAIIAIIAIAIIAIIIYKRKYG